MTASVYERKAKAVGLEIRPSKRTGKKFDVYKGGVFQTSIGQKGAMDYEKYLRQDKELADARRKAYKARHIYRKIKVRDGRITAAWAADKILW